MVKRKGSEEFVDLGLSGGWAKRTAVKASRKFGNIFKSALSEAGQEFTQFGANKFAQIITQINILGNLKV